MARLLILMPLIKSSAKQAVGKNIKTEMAAGHKPQKQAIAIALNTQRQAQKQSRGGRSKQR